MAFPDRMAPGRKPIPPLERRRELAAMLRAVVDGVALASKAMTPADRLEALRASYAAQPATLSAELAERIVTDAH